MYLKTISPTGHQTLTLNRGRPSGRVYPRRLRLEYLTDVWADSDPSKWWNPIYAFIGRGEHPRPKELPLLQGEKELGPYNGKEFEQYRQVEDRWPGQAR